MAGYVTGRNKSNEGTLIALQKQLGDVQTCLDNLDERYYAKRTMDTETYQKLRQKYFSQKGEILKMMQVSGKSSSNLEMYLDSALQLSIELSATWDSLPLAKKESLQKLIFLEGVYYNLKNQSFRTEKTNSVLSCIAAVAGFSGTNEKGQGSMKTALSNSVERHGFEP